MYMRRKGERELLVVVVVLLVVGSVRSVDRSKFKRCDEASFCGRQRNTAPHSLEYKIMDSTGRLEGNKYYAGVLDSKTQKELTLEIVGYKDSIIHMKINEKSALRSRHEVKDVVQAEALVEIPCTVSYPDGQSTLLTYGTTGTTVRIQHDPLKVDVLRDGELYITANARGLLNFEQYRTKQQQTEQREGDAQVVDEVWEEYYKEHKDSRQYGPSSVGLDFTFSGAEAVYGIPEHASDLALKDTKGSNVNSDPYRLYNLDVFEYELDNPMALYGSVPFMIAHDSKKTTGLFWVNAAETWIDVSKRTDVVQVDTHWFSESGIIDVFFLLGPNPRDLFRQYSGLTGTITLPPLFSIAYHQCRWNYKDEADVSKVDSGFDEHDIPYDVIWLDIEHTDSKKYFTWEKTYFPTPERMQNELATKQRKMVTIVDPHIKRDGGYYIHNEASSKGLYVKNHDGQDYEGWCWPGSSSWLDFVNPEIRNWWAQQFSYSSYQGSTNILFTWNDMNEPSVFNGPEVTMHKDARHYGDLEHRDIHNMYGYYMHMSTFQGLLERNPGHNERPFLLTRAFFAGSQRYGAVWTGDNAAQWSHLAISQPMLLSLGLGGITFSGADVGGFFGNPDAELFTRWYQAGAFQPFFRGHAHLDTKRREPWLFGEPYTTHIRDAIRTRYSLLPYWYTTFRNSSVTGIPIMRPLWVEYPTDKSTFTMQDQFLIGSDILVKPVVASQQNSIQVYLPGDQPWYEFAGTGVYSGSQTITVQTPLDKIPVFMRGGSIIPKKERARRSSTLMAKDPYTLVVSLDNKGSAFGNLYVDDGHSYDFKKGLFVERNFIFHDNKLESVGTSSYSTENTVERVVINGFASVPAHVILKISGQPEKELTFDYDSAHKVLVVRKPDAPITKDFVLEIK